MKKLDEILKYFYLNSLDLTGTTEKRVMDEALTAIYEIGLTVIGADEEGETVQAPCPDLKPGCLVYHTEFRKTPQTVLRNDLRASQRKAWALKCNIKEGE